MPLMKAYREIAKRQQTLAEGKQKPAKARIKLKEKRDGKHLASPI